MPDINWDLINGLAAREHPLLNVHADHKHDCCPWDGEVLHEARTAHHLLDIAGVPHRKSGHSHYSGNLDARTYQLVIEVMQLRAQVERIRGWHARETGPAGTVGDYCTECGVRWPCGTYLLAGGEEPDYAEP